jgi:hypothetical protein
MTKDRRIVVIGKQREFDEERWKQLLTAMAYVLHERRKQLGDVDGPSEDDSPDEGRNGGDQ